MTNNCLNFFIARTLGTESSAKSVDQVQKLYQLFDKIARVYYHLYI